MPAKRHENYCIVEPAAAGSVLVQKLNFVFKASATMRKIFIVVFCTFFCISTFAQKTEPAYQLSKEDYLQKNKNQKTAAWIMLGGGFVMSTGAIIWAINNLFEPDQGESVLFFAGLAAMGGSIPLFIASGRNKRKAAVMTVNLKLENSTALHSIRITRNYSPSVSLKIGIK